MAASITPTRRPPHRGQPSPRGGAVLLSLVLPFLALACAAEAPSSSDPAPPAVASAALAATVGTISAAPFRLHSEPITRLRFPVPAAGVSVESRHFDPSLPAEKFRHSIRLSTTRTVVIIEIWDNPRGLALHPWFDANLSFLVDESTEVTDQPMTRAHVPGIRLSLPASEQATSQAVAVFLAGDQIFRVSCVDPVGDPAALRLFEQVIDKLETGVTP